MDTDTDTSHSVMSMQFQCSTLPCQHKTMYSTVHTRACTVVVISLVSSENFSYLWDYFLILLFECLILVAFVIHVWLSFQSKGLALFLLCLEWYYFITQASTTYSNQTISEWNSCENSHKYTLLSLALLQLFGLTEHHTNKATDIFVYIQ